jgi:hypothetical protein
MSSDGIISGIDEDGRLVHPAARDLVEHLPPGAS